MKNEVRTMALLVADVLLAELQRGVEVLNVKVGDKVSLKENGNSISFLLGSTEIVTTSEFGEFKDKFLFHHKARRQLSPLTRDVFEKVVKGGDFGESYIYDIPSILSRNFPELDECTRESYAYLFQSLSWMLRTGVLEWTV